jgi:uncharacterized protein YdbL (DUF1318 family)
MNRLILALCATLVLGVTVPAVNAQASKEELHAHFKARRTELRELKKSGKIGETTEGYVDAVDSKAAAEEKVSAVVREENKDRRALYQLLADEINKENPSAPVKATIETIAVRNVERNLRRAGPDEFLRVGKDHWIRVKDYPRFQQLTRLKTQGTVGETSEGNVEIVKEADRADKAVITVVQEENARRAAEYKALAEKERVDVSAIGQRMGARNIAAARVGDMVKDKSGAWRKK